MHVAFWDSDWLLSLSYDSVVYCSLLWCCSELCTKTCQLVPETSNSSLSVWLSMLPSFHSLIFSVCLLFLLIHTFCCSLSCHTIFSLSPHYVLLISLSFLFLNFCQRFYLQTQVSPPLLFFFLTRVLLLSVLVSQPCCGEAFWPYTVRLISPVCCSFAHVVWYRSASWTGVTAVYVVLVRLW